MLKTIFILVLTLVLVFFGLTFLANPLGVERNEMLLWTLIILGALLVERLLKYLFMYPFKAISGGIKGHVMANAVQNGGFSMAYICIWLAIGVTPITAVVNGEIPTKIISNPLFLKVALLLLITTVVFSLLWLWSAKIFKK